MEGDAPSSPRLQSAPLAALGDDGTNGLSMASSTQSSCHEQ
jgi:hypothetical protein